jgi:hypothetical protein
MMRLTAAISKCLILNSNTCNFLVMAENKKTSKAAAAVKRAGVSGVNKPKRTPNHPTKSHVVVAKEGDKVKTIRFGQQGVRGAGKSPKTAKEKARRKSFKARHAKNISKGKMSAAYWANSAKW